MRQCMIRCRRADELVVVVTQTHFQQLRRCLYVAILETLDLKSQVPVIALALCGRGLR